MQCAVLTLLHAMAIMLWHNWCVTMQLTCCMPCIDLSSISSSPPTLTRSPSQECGYAPIHEPHAVVGWDALTKYCSIRTVCTAPANTLLLLSCPEFSAAGPQATLSLLLLPLFLILHSNVAVVAAAASIVSGMHWNTCEAHATMKHTVGLAADR